MKIEIGEMSEVNCHCNLTSRFISRFPSIGCKGAEGTACNNGITQPAGLETYPDSHCSAGPVLQVPAALQHCYRSILLTARE